MKKIIFAGSAGIASVIACIVLIGSLTENVFSLPQVPVSIIDNVEIVKYQFEHSSIGLLWGKLIAGILGGFLNGFVIAKMKGGMKTSLIIGLLFSLLAGFYMMMVANPVWFWISLIICFIPCSLLGYLTGSNRATTGED